MSRTSQIGQVVVGDASVLQATWLPNLNFIKADDKLQIISDPNLFQFGDTLILDNNFSARKNETEKVTISISNEYERYFELEFITKNITNTSTWFINLPVTWQLSSNTKTEQPPNTKIIKCVQQLNDMKQPEVLAPDYWKDEALPWTPRYDGYMDGDAVSLTEPIDDVFNNASYVTPTQWQLQTIKSCEITIGTNKINLGSKEMSALNSILAMNTLVDQDEYFKKMWGFYNCESGYSVYNNKELIKHDPHLKSFYENLSTLSYDPLFINTTALPDSPKIIIPINIPIKMLNSFFHQDRWIPAGVPFKLKIAFQTQPRVIMVDNRVITTVQNGDENPELRWYITNELINIKEATLNYTSYLLKTHIQNIINRKWLAEPFLFNYVIPGKTYIPCDGITTEFKTQIALNQEIPIQLIIYLRKNEGSSNTSINTGVNYSKRLQWGFFDTTTSESTFNDDGIPTGATALSFMYEYDLDNTPIPFLLFGYTLEINGVKKYGSSMETNFSWLGQQNSDRILQDMITFTAFNSSGNIHSRTLHNKNYGIGQYYHLTVDPCQFVDNNNRSTGVGAQNASLELICYAKGIDIWDETSNPLANKLTPQQWNGTQPFTNLKAIGQSYTIEIVKVLPEQIRMDINRNVKKIKFPAVATNSGTNMEMSNIINSN